MSHFNQCVFRLVVLAFAFVVPAAAFAEDGSGSFYSDGAEPLEYGDMADYGDHPSHDVGYRNLSGYGWSAYQPGYSLAPAAPAARPTYYYGGYYRAVATVASRPAVASYLTSQTYEPGDGYRYPLYYAPSAGMYFYISVSR